MDNKDEVVYIDNIIGKFGEKIVYMIEIVLKLLIEKGYLLKEDGFFIDVIFDIDEIKV